ncbi:hypothetical protein [Gallibacterium anatis]|uniref:hypothetical protein n=1 Tax=Gallibacterium anatis TaxID=750 RepID=UPI0038B3ECE2
MKENTNKQLIEHWLNHSLTDETLQVVDIVFKFIEEYGVEGAKSHFAVESAKRDLLKAINIKKGCVRNGKEKATKFAKLPITGRFRLVQNQEGKYNLSLTLIDLGVGTKSLQARQEILQAFLLDLHQGRNCLGTGRVHIDKRLSSPFLEKRSLIFEVS